MKITNPIALELMKATGLKPKAKESENAFLKRLTKAANKLEESVWDKLSDEAQEWLNLAVKAIKAKKKLPDLPESDEDESEDESDEDESDEDEDESEDERDEDEDSDDEDEPAPKKAKKAKKGKKGKKGKKAKEKKAPRPEGATSKFRRICIAHPTEKKALLSKRAEKQGLSISEATINTVFFHTMQTLKILAEDD